MRERDDEPGNGEVRQVREQKCCPGDVGRGALSTRLLTAPSLHLESKSWVRQVCLSHLPLPHLFYIIFAPGAMTSTQVTEMVKNLPAMWKSWVRSLGWKDPLEKWMAIHSSVHAWRIPWTEEPGGIQSMWLQRVRYDWVTNTHTLSDFFQFPLGPWFSPAVLEWRMAGYLEVKRIDSLQI